MAYYSLLNPISKTQYGTPGIGGKSITAFNYPTESEWMQKATEVFKPSMDALGITSLPSQFRNLTGNPDYITPEWIQSSAPDYLKSFYNYANVYNAPDKFVQGVTGKDEFGNDITGQIVNPKYADTLTNTGELSGWNREVMPRTNAPGDKSPWLKRAGEIGFGTKPYVPPTRGFSAAEAPSDWQTHADYLMPEEWNTQYWKDYQDIPRGSQSTDWFGDTLSSIMNTLITPQNILTIGGSLVGMPTWLAAGSGSAMQSGVEGGDLNAMTKSFLSGGALGELASWGKGQLGDLFSTEAYPDEGWTQDFGSGVGLDTLGTGSVTLPTWDKLPEEWNFHPSNFEDLGVNHDWINEGYSVPESGGNLQQSIQTLQDLGGTSVYDSLGGLQGFNYQDVLGEGHFFGNDLLRSLDANTVANLGENSALATMLETGMKPTMPNYGVGLNLGSLSNLAETIKPEMSGFGNIGVQALTNDNVSAFGDAALTATPTGIDINEITQQLQGTPMPYNPNTMSFSNAVLPHSSMDADMSVQGLQSNPLYQASTSQPSFGQQAMDFLGQNKGAFTKAGMRGLGNLYSQHKEYGALSDYIDQMKPYQQQAGANVAQLQDLFSKAGADDRFFREKLQGTYQPGADIRAMDPSALANINAFKQAMARKAGATGRRATPMAERAAMEHQAGLMEKYRGGLADTLNKSGMTLAQLSGALQQAQGRGADIASKIGGLRAQREAALPTALSNFGQYAAQPVVEGFGKSLLDKLFS